MLVAVNNEWELADGCFGGGDGIFKQPIVGDAIEKVYVLSTRFVDAKLVSFVEVRHLRNVFEVHDGGAAEIGSGANAIDRMRHIRKGGLDTLNTCGNSLTSKIAGVGHLRSWLARSAVAGVLGGSEKPSIFVNFLKVAWSVRWRVAIGMRRRSKSQGSGQDRVIGSPRNGLSKAQNWQFTKRRACQPTQQMAV